MDRSRISDLAHADHPIASPLSDASVDRLLALAVAGQRTVLDLGCGDGSWLLRALRRDPSLVAVGVDHSDAGFDRVRAQAEREGLSARLDLVRADARSWTSAERFDVVLSVGASHAFGGLEPTLAAIDGHLRPGGRALVGECFWERPPTPQVLDLLGAEPDDYADLAATVEVAASNGWVPLHGHVSTLEEWDDYEWSWTGSLARWATEHPDDPDSDQVMTASVEHRRAWLQGYRGTLGFLTMLLGRSPAS
ncbi:SAM-dependent methyltransferase [Clavibacter nebraskensis]|uniref:SAM-dependent methyltransferase n=1 Tax=Clavibacter nebraskensis TaxID=31963 RepID=UPI003F87C12E